MSASLELLAEQLAAEERAEQISLYWGDEVLNLPQPPWLIEDILQEQGLGVLYGPPGVAKSLLAQDWSMCIANGWKWFGKETVNGPVIYIMGEGQGGLPNRIRAWMVSRSADRVPANVGWVMNPLSFTRPETGKPTAEQKALVELVAQHRPKLVVVDTLAANYGGGNENSQQDMNGFLQTCRELQTLGAAVLVIHHANKEGKDMRGSTVLKGAADTVVMMDGDFGEAVYPDGTRRMSLTKVKMKCMKQKDGVPFATWDLALSHHEVEDGTSSVTLDFARTEDATPDLLTERQIDVIVHIVREYQRTEGVVTYMDIQTATGVSAHTVKAALARLLEVGFIDEERLPTKKGVEYVRGLEVEEL